MPPVGALAIELSEITIDHFDNNTTDPQQYSIVNQVERMAESRKQIEEDKILRKRLKLEEYRIAQEMEIIRLNDQIRIRGYGPRPDYYTYSQQSDYQRRYLYQCINSFVVFQ